MAKQRAEPGRDEAERVYEAVLNLHSILGGYRNLSVDVTGMSIRGPKTRSGEYFCTVRGEDEEGLPVVAFHSAFSLVDLLQGVAARLRNGTFKWREDEFRTKR